MMIDHESLQAWHLDHAWRGDTAAGQPSGTSTAEDTMSDMMTKTRTITLTDRPPVTIREDEWPVIAHGRHHEHDGQVESQANRTTNINIRVRQHADGRTIVYGIDDYDTHFQRERSWRNKAGVLLPADSTDLVAAIRAVGATLLTCEGSSDADIRAAVRDCIADLPALEI